MTTVSASQTPTPSTLQTGSVSSQAPVQAVETPLRASRTESIDVIRLIAAAGIVFIHAAKSEPLIHIGHVFRFAVPFYLCASLYFQSRSLRQNKKRRTLFQYVVSRFRRLYLPFLAWSAIYLIARDVKRLTILHLGPVPLEPGMLWKGVEYHLWFLPFLLIWSIILAVLYWTLLKWNRAWRWPLIIVAVVAGIAFGLARMPASLDEVFPSPTYAYVQWWRSLPATFWGLAFALFMTMGPVLYSIPTSLGIAGIALAVYCSVRQAFYGIEVIPRGLSGLGCILAALMPWSRGQTVAVLAHYGRYAYGIYLCHVLVVEIIRVGESHLHLVPSTSVDLVTFVLGFAGSLGLVCALGRSPRLAWLNG